MNLRIQPQAKADKEASLNGPSRSSKPTKGSGSHDQELAPVPPIVDEVLQSPGQPLDKETRTFLEPHFGHDFSQVRVHTDLRAALSANAVDAIAYTFGTHIVLSEAGSALSTKERWQLLSHELTHTLQQRDINRTGAQLTIGRVDSGFEREADQVAASVVKATDWSVSSRRAAAAPNERAPVSKRELFQQPISSVGAQSVLMRRVRRGAAAGCGICMNDPRGSKAGEIAHKEVQNAFISQYPDIVPERAVPRIPGSGIDLSYEKFQHGIHKLFIGEIKPLDDAGLQAGLGRDKLKDYWREMTFSHRYDQVSLMTDSPPKAPLYFYNPANPPRCPKQIIHVQMTERGLYQYFCEPPFSQLVRDPRCRCTRRRKQKEEKRKYARKHEAEKEYVKTERSSQQVRVVSFHPDFYDCVKQLPAFDAPAGHDFIIAIDGDLFNEAVREASRRRVERTERLMRIDPRGVPFIQVTAPLYGLAPFVLALEIALIGALIGLGAAGLAAAAATSAGATTGIAAAGATAGTVTTSTGVTLTVIQGGAATLGAGTAATQMPVVVATVSKAAAAIIIARLVALGSSEAQAAESVKPLVGKRIFSIIDVTDNPAGASRNLGGATIVDGQAFRTIINLTTREGTL